MARVAQGLGGRIVVSELWEERNLLLCGKYLTKHLALCRHSLDSRISQWCSTPSQSWIGPAEQVWCEKEDDSPW